MRVISKKRLREFWLKHPDAEKPLQIWYSICKKETFENFSEIKNLFNSADLFDDKVIFNIGGNKFRLIASIQFKIKTLFIKGVFTHQEYDRGKWKK
ncbi:MAG: type II toxin-antitoxin system HigB family toxin [Melioribacteraceae bacterium]